jgi:hypothetical protein
MALWLFVETTLAMRSLVSIVSGNLWWSAQHLRHERHSKVFFAVGLSTTPTTSPCATSMPLLWRIIATTRGDIGWLLLDGYVVDLHVSNMP